MNSSKNRVEEFIRVDHAGERGAVKIYEGQLLALNTFVKDDALKKTIEEMKLHEKEHCDFFETEITPGTFVIFNPPYGERIDLGINDFYEKVGTTLKHDYQECTVWLISSDIKNMKFIGLKPSKKIKVMNGELECSFRKFEVYGGSKKTSKQ